MAISSFLARVWPKAEQSPPALAPIKGGWIWSILIGIAVGGIYLSNRLDPIETEDVVPSQLLPVTILRGHGPYLDEFNDFLTSGGTQGPNDQEGWWMARSRGHMISRYSIGPALVALPFVAVQMVVLDRTNPTWNNSAPFVFLHARRMAKVAAACITALTAVFLHRLLKRLGVGRFATVVTLAAALGSDLWVVASQAMWEHGPATLMLVIALYLLSSKPSSKTNLVLAGAATGVMVCCRSLDLVFAIAITCRVAQERSRLLLWFLPIPLLLAGALISYNIWFFDSLMGGLPQIETYHAMKHNVSGTWSAPFLVGFLGTLFSPNRGLFTFSPWVFLALITLPFTFRRVREWPLGPWMLGAIAVNLVIFSKYSVWWAGHSFGPRYWTECVPIFAVFFGFTLEWAKERCRPLVAVSAVSVIFAIAAQSIGAFCYPSSWCVSPVDVDRQPSRVWDWSDNELARCLKEGVKPWEPFKNLRKPK